jgi:hypothetical protein
MKTATEKLQYIVARRNGQNYRVFLKDLRRIRPVKHRHRPKVPEWEESDGSVSPQSCHGLQIGIPC